MGGANADGRSDREPSVSISGWIAALAPKPTYLIAAARAHAQPRVFRAGQFGMRHYCCVGLNASRTMDVIEEHKVAPLRVVIDHVNEETIEEVKDRGFWAGFSIYPNSKMTA